MNFLILSAGRRSKLVEYFVKEFKDIGKIVATDCDFLAPAIHIADKFYVVPRIDAQNYIETILDICKKEDIGGIISLIDPELSLIGKNEKKFTDIGVKLFTSKYDTAELCFDKFEMFEFLQKSGFNCAKTYVDLEKFKNDLNAGIIDFPVFVKPRRGSASLGINRIDNIKHLELLFELGEDLIIQEFLKGQEYGADCYIDCISKKPVSIFIKKKIRMRSGETDKSVSFKNDELFKILEELSERLDARGVIDIDIFDIDGKWYISEVNPRFGGGYPHAYECGCNFPKMILNNLNGNENEDTIGKYEENIYLVKHDNVMILKGE